MLAASSPNHSSCVADSARAGLRDQLRRATAFAHRNLDERFGNFGLTSLDGYRRFLETTAAALMPLERALERDGVADIVSDWTQRSRRADLDRDLQCIDGVAEPLPDLEPFSRNEVLGAVYVLEGSRLGAKYILRSISAAKEPLIAAATDYLRHGSGQPLWRTFLTRLESEPVTPRDEAEIIAGAHRAFAAFARAAGSSI
jgi:heme oxygenase